jgi:hypothetical protein
MEEEDEEGWSELLPALSSLFGVSTPMGFRHISTALPLLPSLGRPLPGAVAGLKLAVGPAPPPPPIFYCLSLLPLAHDLLWDGPVIGRWGHREGDGLGQVTGTLEGAAGREGRGDKRASEPRRKVISRLSGSHPGLGYFKGRGEWVDELIGSRGMLHQHYRGRGEGPVALPILLLTTTRLAGNLEESGKWGEEWENCEKHIA